MEQSICEKLAEKLPQAELIRCVYDYNHTLNWPGGSALIAAIAAVAAVIAYAIYRNTGGCGE